MSRGRLPRACRGAALVLLACVSPAAADVSDYIGKPVAAVRIEAAGVAVGEPRILELVETRVGEPLNMAAVRESIIHLFSLGRAENVSVSASPSGSGVALTYTLVPLRIVSGIQFTGARGQGVDEGRLRELVAQRFGASPRPGRVAEIAAVIAADLAEVGYLHAEVTPEPSPASRERTPLVFAIAPGERTRIGTIALDGDPNLTVQALERSLRISAGAPFLRDVLNERIEAYLETRRALGYYAARLTFVPQFTDGDRIVNLAFTYTPGPHVRVVFAGDPLPESSRDEFVPIAREGSVDEDLLEDSSNRIQDYLHAQGYRDASAVHTREETAGEVVITFTVKRGSQYRVGRVDFSGNVSVPLTDLQPRLRVHPGQPFSASAIEADLAVVEGVYRSRGFGSVDAQSFIESEDAAADAIDVPVAIQVVVTENVRTLVEGVRIEALRALPEADLRTELGLQPGGPFSMSQMSADRDGIQLRLANLGYQSAVVTATPGLSADATRADVVFTVREGPRLFVDHLLIVGNERTRTATIERELQFRPGEPLGQEALNESQRRLAALGLFRRARITLLGHGDASKRDVLVTIEEAPVTTIGYGGGVEVGQRLRTDEDTGAATEQVEFAPRAFFEIGRRNLFGKNRSINLFTRVSIGNLQSETTTRTGLGFGEYRVIGTYREPRVFGSTADAVVTEILEQQIRSSFNFTRRALSAELGRRLSREVSVSGNYQIQRAELFDERIDPAFRIPIDRLFPQVRLSSFSGSIVRDTRDDLADPTSGRFLSANGQIAGRRIGSEVGFAKSYFAAQMFRIVPGTSRVVFAGSARLSVATGFPRETIDRDENGDPILGANGQPVIVTVRDLPASERSFAGGDTTVRGFALDQLGTPATIDKDGFPTGGAGLVILNGELRIPVFRAVGIVGFVDAGNVFLRASDISLGDLRAAVGFGVRYRSPIGPIRVDLGFKTKRQTNIIGARESLTALHITLGQAF